MKTSFPKVSNNPPKGTYDWLPDEFAIRKYIFDTWRQVCQSYGYEEYLTPIVEDAAIYKAKSGEDVAGPELMVIKKDEGELAIRPEMTPSVTRLVTKVYKQIPKPIRYFSVANFMRFQKPQRGRNREFWQLNFDIFGSNSIQADIEILRICLDIMLSFNPPKDSFVIYINNRKLIDTVLFDLAKIDESQKTETIRIMDKWEKLPKEELKKRLTTIGLKETQIDTLIKFMESTTEIDLVTNLPELINKPGYQETKQIIESLTESGYGDWFKFQPNIIRGFDYYDGMVFEAFDKHPDNNRSMFGGGRYNGLAGIFGSDNFPAVGAAPGDETTRLFLNSWGLDKEILEKLKRETYFVPLLDNNLINKTNTIANQLRKEGKIVEIGLELQNLGKALAYANKKAISKVVIFGENENTTNTYLIKDMSTGDQKLINLSEIIKFLVQ